MATINPSALICAILIATIASWETIAEPFSCTSEREQRGTALNNSEKSHASSIISLQESSVFRTNFPTGKQAETFFFEQRSLEAEVTNLPIYKYERKGRQAKAVVILIHGLFQHGQSMAPLAKHLAQNGYIALAIDQRGHGGQRVRVQCTHHTRHDRDRLRSQ